MESFNLSERQIHILKSVIEEYINTALPVGSETLDKKYNLGVSPATIRNEMVRLTEKGFLKQPHTSAGRVPSPIALKYYVEKILKPKELSIAEEVAVKEKVWNLRHEEDKLFKQLTNIVSQRTKTLSLLTTESGDVYYSGLSYLLQTPEFYNLELTRRLFILLEEFDYWKRLFFVDDSPIETYRFLVGEELGENLEQCGIVCVKFRLPNQSLATIGVVGSNRLDCGYIIPVVQYISHLMGEIFKY